MSKIPFLVIRNFVSPLVCERVINDLGILKIPPMIGQNGKPKRMLFMNRLNQMRLSALLDPYVNNIEEHFECEYFGTHNIQFEWYPENSVPEPAKSDGYAKLNGEWIKSREIDLTGILWLTENNEDDLFDPEFECYGGKLEFPTFDTSFRPERGTLVIFPTAPNFLHTVAAVKAGTLCQARFVIRTSEPYKYDPNKFNHNPNAWKL